MHFEFDKYANRKSLFHSWDERYKIISLITYIISISILKDIRILLPLALFNFLFALLSNLPLKYLVLKLKFPTLFFLVILIIIPISGRGQIFFKIAGCINIYKTSLFFAVKIILRGYSIIICGILIFATSTFDKTIRAMRIIKLPEIPVMIILFTHRYINLYRNNTLKMKRAMKLRGGVKSYTKKLFVSFSSIIVSLIIRSYEQTQTIYNAMILRGYESKAFVHYPFKSNIFDYIKSAFFIILSGFLIILEFYH